MTNHNLTYSQANHSIAMPMHACNPFLIHIMATSNTETITEYRSLHIQQVCIQLPTYTDNVALPAFTRCCCSNRSIYTACRAHSSKPAAAGCMCHVGSARIGPMRGQTYGQTDTVPFHRPCSEYYEGSASNE